MPARPGPSPLHGELIKANQFARQPKLQDGLTACGLASKSLLWGFDFIEMFGPTYQLSPDGESALIVPVFEEPGGDLIDLAACRLRDRRLATRKGIARALGEKWIDVAIEYRVELLLFANPMHWLIGGCGGLVILDWTQTPFLLDGVESVVCASRSLARRVHDTTRRMSRPPRLHFVHPSSVVQRSKHHV